MPGVCPVKDRPQLVVRILNRCSCQAEPPYACELVVRSGNFRPRVFDAVSFIDNDNRPGQLIK